jgi:hypothetical protein
MLNLGKETGSLVNHILSSSNFKDPVAGDAATVLHWSDRTPATVSHWFAKSQVVELREDRAICTNYETQEYTYEPSDTGATYHFKREKNGTWVQVYLNRTTGRWIKCKGSGLVIGRREKYRDPSF